MKSSKLSVINRYIKQGTVKAKENLKRTTTDLSEKILKNTGENYTVTTPQRYSYYSECYKNMPLNNKLVLFEAYNGTSFTGDLYALYNEMQNDSRFEDYEFVWVYDNEERFNEMTSSLSTTMMFNTRFVCKASNEYLEALATAGYYFNNEAAPIYYTKREGQIFTTVWRSIPFAYKGYDKGFEEENPYPIRNWLRSYLMSDYITSANQKTTEILKRSYRLDGIYDGKILESGCPRFDAYQNINLNRETIIQKLSDIGLNINLDKKTIALHFSEDIKHNKVNDERFIQEMNYYIEQLSEKYNLMFFLPNKLQNLLLSENSELNRYLVPSWVDRSEVLSITDILVTDHSSFYYEFIPLKRPVYFYDFEEKSLDNHYVTLDEMKGNYCHTIIDVVNDILKSNYTGDEHSNISKVSKNYIDYIFFNNQLENLSVKGVENNKKRLLFYAGNMKNNFITYRFLQVLKQIDLEKYDISLLLPTNDLDSTSYENLRKVSTVVRPFFFQGYAVFTREEDLQDKVIRNLGLTFETQYKYPIAAYQREVRRTLANCKFNAAIDFQGNDFYWARYIAESNSDYKVLLQQYNLSYQWDKAKKNKRKSRLKSMNCLMNYYQKFDQIIHIKRNFDLNMDFTKDYIAKEYVSYYEANDEEPNVDFPYYQEKNVPLLELDSISDKLILKDYTAVKFYPNIYDLSYSIELDVSDAETIIGISKASINGVEYIKVLVDSLFFGWIDIDSIESQTNYIISTKETSYYAKINNKKGHSITFSPNKTSEENYVVSASYYLSDIIVKVDEEVETSDYTYCKISIDDETLGYLDKRALNPINARDKLISSNHLRNAERIETRILKSESYEGKAKLKSPETVTLYKKSYGSYRCEVLELKGTKLAQRPLRITWCVTTKAGKSYEILDDFNQHAWVREEDLIFL